MKNNLTAFQTWVSVCQAYTKLLQHHQNVTGEEMGRKQAATLADVCILQVIFVFCTKLETGHLQDPGQRLWGLAPKTSLHPAAAGSTASSLLESFIETAKFQEGSGIRIMLSKSNHTSN